MAPGKVTTAPTAVPDRFEAADFRWTPLFPRRMATEASTCEIVIDNIGDKALADSNNENGDDGYDDATDSGNNLYPNCDVSVWLRSCTKEVLEPLHGITTGTIPKWLKGSLLRNGPGSLKVGNMTFDHLFDSSALLHRFAISGGEVTYQNRFLQSQTFKRNAAARRIVVTEFGTKAVPDPCQSIFQRVSAMFTPGESFSDNAMISVYPFGDEYYTFTESPVIHRIDPSTLETLDRVNLSKHVSIVNHSSHPHVMADGTVYNLGLTVTAQGPKYAILEFPPAKSGDAEKEGASMFEQARIVGRVPARWPLHPAYMHTFGFTQDFFVIVEQPLSVSVPAMLKNQITNSPMAASFRWYPEKYTQIHLVSRKTGDTTHKFITEAFFYLHIINCYEEREHVVVDICCYRDPSMLDCMYVESLKTLQQNPEYARMFRSRPLRFVLPLQMSGDSNDANLVTLKGSRATAHRLSSSGLVLVCPELLSSMGCETPRLHYEQYAGRPYRYFYAISSDVDLDNPGTLIKVDILTQTNKTWSEKNVYPSEPIFIPSPNSMDEDDGVVLSALVWGKAEENKVGLLVLDASSWTELGRTVFNSPGPVPKCLHGWFANGR